MVNFYSRFLSMLSMSYVPFTMPCAEKGPGKMWIWSTDRNKAFWATKNALTNAALLAHPLFNALIALTTDASDYTVGMVCEQWAHRAWQPLAFFSSAIMKGRTVHLIGEATGKNEIFYITNKHK